MLPLGISLGILIIKIGMKELFTDLANDLGQYLTYALQKPNEFSLCRVAACNKN